MPKRLARDLALRTTVLAGAAGVLVGFSLSAFAADAEFCVRCTGPDQTYRCKVTGVGPQYSDAAKLFCVLTTTKTEGHAKCTATRDPSCQGIQKVYNYGGGPLPGAINQSDGVQQYKDRVSREQEKFEAPSEKGRATLFDLGKGVVSGTKSRFGYGPDETPQPDAPPPQATAPTVAPQAGPPVSDQRPAAPTAYAQTPESDESFAHRSYRCLKSFFFNCGSEDAAN
ncbi:hypothetical protein A7A08_00211 [Methyloligella halotolerans]|uniref:Uncharacterized protein n=1 Tax=Methyloligella halotolerans TaxID=1177755 RepID=A0A1E2S221_9HYPH|nr:hypothetical protein [Methyloligella halotolerans]ODA68389.1 hypothetical protein A7A08_00211 [Methyloligella halotolerans]